MSNNNNSVNNSSHRRAIIQPPTTIDVSRRGIRADVYVYKILLLDLSHEESEDGRYIPRYADNIPLSQMCIDTVAYSVISAQLSSDPEYSHLVKHISVGIEGTNGDDAFYPIKDHWGNNVTLDMKYVHGEIRQNIPPSTWLIRPYLRTYVHTSNVKFSDNNHSIPYVKLSLFCKTV